MVASWRASPVLLCLLAIALATGAAASLVTSTTRPIDAGVGAAVSYNLPDTVLGLLLILPFCLGLGAVLYQRARGAFRLPPSVVATFIGILLLLTVFALVAHYLNPGPSGLGSTTGTGSGTGGGSPGPNQTGTGGIGGPSTGFLPYALPSWVPFVTAAVIALALAGVVVPAMWSAVARRRERASVRAIPAVVQSETRAALAQASSELSGGMDPRAVIERLYNRLLERLTAVAGDLSGRTPEEIRTELLLPLGVRPAAATSLTRLFEEARYSTHPMGRDAADRVQAAVGAAAADLARMPTPR